MLFKFLSNFTSLDLGSIFLVSQSVSQSFWHCQKLPIVTVSKNCDTLCDTRNIDPEVLNTIVLCDGGVGLSRLNNHILSQEGDCWKFLALFYSKITITWFVKVNQQKVIR